MASEAGKTEATIIGAIVICETNPIAADTAGHTGGAGFNYQRQAPAIRLGYIIFILLSSYQMEAMMSARLKLTTTVSSKGQVILPKAIREQLRWPTGTELTVEDTPEGVLLKAKPAFAPTRPKDVFGSLANEGPAMRPKKHKTTGSNDLFRARLDQIINMGRPGIETRLVC